MISNISSRVLKLSYRINIFSNRMKEQDKLYYDWCLLNKLNGVMPKAINQHINFLFNIITFDFYFKPCL